MGRPKGSKNKSKTIIAKETNPVTKPRKKSFSRNREIFYKESNGKSIRVNKIFGLFEIVIKNKDQTMELSTDSVKYMLEYLLNNAIWLNMSDLNKSLNVINKTRRLIEIVSSRI